MEGEPSGYGCWSCHGGVGGGDVCAALCGSLKGLQLLARRAWFMCAIEFPESRLFRLEGEG